MSNFVMAESLDHAVEVLAADGVKVIAGGTDLMIHLREIRLSGGAASETILDVSRLKELKGLDPEADRPYVGAGVTFHELESDPEVAQYLPLLAQAAATVGSVQVRQTASIGGNVANASPAADGMTALTALGAQVEIASLEGTRMCPLEELVTAPNKTTLRPQELIVGFQLDKLPAGGQMFAKVGRRQAVSVARLNLAVCLDAELKDPRTVLGACFPSPRRLKNVEKVILQGEPGDELWWAAGHQAAQHFTDVCGWRSSATYKVPAVTRVTARTLGQAWSSLAGAS
jgi:CO/xanthine dehydrogenase FAD-binding subunit